MRKKKRKVAVVFLPVMLMVLTACGNGSSYTEAIPASGHQWVATTETVSYPSAGHY